MLGRLFKRRLLPSAHRPPLAGSERVLAWALDTNGQAVVATNLRLWVAGAGTAWNEVSKAKWDGTALTVRETLLPWTISGLSPQWGDSPFPRTFLSAAA